VRKVYGGSSLRERLFNQSVHQRNQWSKNFFIFTPTAEPVLAPKQRRQDHSSGFRKTVQWYLENPTWIANILSGTYQLERLETQAP
jgi:dTDP-D-glucose 4,6-dehydratase